MIPDDAQLNYMAKHDKPVVVTPAQNVKQKQARLEAAIAKDGLIAQNVSELADSYVAQGQTKEAIALMKRYYAKYPKDIQMLDKLGIIYHVAGMEKEYIGILEEQNELLPSINTSYILQAYYSRPNATNVDPEKALRVGRHLIKLQPENTQNYRNLIFFLFKAGRGSEVIDVVKLYRERFPNQVDYSFIFPLIDQLIKEGMYDEALTEALPWVEKTPQRAIKDFSTMYVNAGQPAYAAKILRGHQDVILSDPDLLLIALKVAVVDSPREALILSEIWMQDHPNDIQMLENFGHVMLASNRRGILVNLYKSHKGTVLANPKLVEIYHAALNKPAATQGVATASAPATPADIVAGFADELADPNVSAARKKSILFALQDRGEFKLALPYARKYAYKYRGDWVILYENMLKKSSDRPALAAFRTHYVRTQNLTDKERQYYVSVFLDGENKAELERLLWQQAQDQPPDSQPVRDLLYIWGVNPGEKQLAWIENRAIAASGNEQLKWLKILENIGAYESMVRVVATVPDASRSLPMVQSYFNTLRVIKDNDVRKEEIAIAVEQENDEQRLAFYANAAKEHEYFDLAARGYERLIGMNPSNNEYLKERGMVAYYDGDIEAATACLHEYYEAGGQDEMAIYFFAELLQQRNTLQAKPLFEKALKLMADKPELTLSQKVITVHILGRLHRFEDAKKMMQIVREENPQSPYIYLDNVELLIDTADYDEAEKMLEESYPKQAIQLPTFHMWRIDSANLARVEKRTLPNELLLVYDRPTSKLPALKQWAMQHPDWIAGFYPGYDTVLIQTQSDKHLIASIEGENLIIEAQTIPESVNQAADNSLKIRGELLHARIEQETHRKADAISRLESLKERHPTDLGTVTGLAIANRSYGNRLKALDLAEEAHLIDPQNRWVNILLADIKKQDRPQVRADVNWLHLGASDMLTTQVTGTQPVTRNLRLQASAENNLYSYRGLQESNGQIGNANGHVVRGQVNAIYEMEHGPVSTTSVYMNPDGELGAGQSIQTQNKYGPAEVYVEYRRPEWWFVERIPDDAYRNRVGYRQGYSPSPEVYVNAGVAATDYNQNDEKHATQTISINGNIHAPISRLYSKWQDVPVVVGYGLDAEYVRNSEFNVDANGNRFRAYPMISREVHFLEATYRKPFDPTLVGEFTGAFAYDRISGQGGPSVAARITQELNKEWAMQLRAGYGISFTQVGEGVTTAGGYVVRNF